MTNGEKLRDIFDMTNGDKLGNDLNLTFGSTNVLQRFDSMSDYINRNMEEKGYE